MLPILPILPIIPEILAVLGAGAGAKMLLNNLQKTNPLIPGKPCTPRIPIDIPCDELKDIYEVVNSLKDMEKDEDDKDDCKNDREELIKILITLLGEAIKNQEYKTAELISKYLQQLTSES